MWSPLKNVGKGEEFTEMEKIKAKSLYMRQTFTTASK